MKRFLLTGHHTFGNRGCEAIVRSTVQLLREQFGEVEVVVASSNISADINQWPEAPSQGIRFIPAYSPWILPFWVRFQSIPLRRVKEALWPFPLPQYLIEAMQAADAVLSIGGDNYSLDYRIPSLLAGLDARSMDFGKPVILWGASVGPFERDPMLMPVMKKHLSRMHTIFARESVTIDYLREMGLHNVRMTVDPAFVLPVQPVDCSAFWPKTTGSEGVLGLNISPLLARFDSRKNAREIIVHEVSKFIHRAVTQYGLSTLLIPHVIPHNTRKNSDAHLMAAILDEVGSLGGRVRLMPPSLNAVQTKYVISRCRFFIGARTHSTIAALSTQVPTISISYSIKAQGINRDLFGHLDYVLDTRNLRTDPLLEKLDLLLRSESGIRAHLQRRVPEWQSSARQAAWELKELLGSQRA